jgi:hypothetical protein
MTTTVRVQARAWGAKIETNGETIELGAHQDRAFHIDEGQSQTFTVTHGEQTQDRAAQLGEEEVPGRRQNDDLVKTTPTGNESGADETGQSSDKPSGRRSTSTT